MFHSITRPINLLETKASRIILPMVKSSSQFEILIPHHEIVRKIPQMANQIAQDYAGNWPYILALANGAAFFGVDLCRALFDKGIDTEFELVHVESYGLGKVPYKIPQLNERFHNLAIANRRVLLVDDVLDTGQTLQLVSNATLKAGATDVKTAVLARKPQSVRKVVFEADYVGFNIENRWIEGGGLDTAKLGRGRRDIIAKD